MMKEIWTFIYSHPEITVIGAVTLIQIAPIKLDPWTLLAKWIRHIVVGDIAEKIDKVSAKVDRLEGQMEESGAIAARMHILRFADELYDHREHSQEYFLQTLDDIRTYHAYCQSHPDFPNGRTAQACEKIKEVYNKVWSEHKF